MLRALFRQLDQRLELNPLLEALKQSRPAPYLSPLAAPPISPGHLALLLVIALVSTDAALKVAPL